MRSKLPMSRLSCVQSCLSPDYRAFKVAYVKTIVQSKLLMSRLSCVQSCLSPDYRAFKVAYIQTIVQLKLPKSRLSCVQSCLCPDYRAFKVAYVQTIMRSKLPMSRLSSVQSCLSPDYRAFKVAYVQTIVRSKLPMFRLLSNHWCFQTLWFWTHDSPLLGSFWSGHIDSRSGTSTSIQTNATNNFVVCSLWQDSTYVILFFSNSSFLKIRIFPIVPPIILHGIILWHNFTLWITM